MTKAGILQKLKATNKLHRFDSQNPDWQDAFLLYNAAHGLTGKDRMCLSCPGSFREIREWLER